MDERHGVPYSIERDGTPIVVQEHSNPGGVWCSDLYLVLVVASRVAGVRAEEAPRFAVVPDAAAVSITCPLDAFVADSDGSPLPAPVHFPVVGASGEGFTAQHLRQGVKSGSAVSVGLGISLEGSFPVPSRQVELSVGCVWVQSELTSI